MKFLKRFAVRAFLLAIFALFGLQFFCGRSTANSQEPLVAAKVPRNLAWNELMRSMTDHSITGDFETLDEYLRTKRMRLTLTDDERSHATEVLLAIDRLQRKFRAADQSLETIRRDLETTEASTH
jgi:hypothetical protein